MLHRNSPRDHCDISYGGVKAHFFKIMANEAAAEPKTSVLALPLLSGSLMLLAVNCRKEATAGEMEK